MAWIVVNADNSLASGPVDVLPIAGSNQRVLEVCLGCAWDSVTGSFKDVIDKLTPLGYLALFTGAEQVAIVTAARTSAQLQLMLLAASMASQIDMGDATVLGGIDALVAMGLLTAARAARVKTGLAPLPS